MKLWLSKKQIPDSITINFGNKSLTYNSDQYEDIINNGISFTDSDLLNGDFSNITISTTVNGTSELRSFKNGVKYTLTAKEDTDSTITTITTDDFSDFYVCKERPTGYINGQEYIIFDGKLYHWSTDYTRRYKTFTAKAGDTAYYKVSTFTINGKTYARIYKQNKSKTAPYYTFNEALNKLYVPVTPSGMNTQYCAVKGSSVTANTTTTVNSDGSTSYTFILTGTLPDGYSESVSFTYSVDATGVLTVSDSGVVSKQLYIRDFAEDYYQVPLVDMKDFLDIDYSDKYYSIEGTIYHAYKKELSLVSWHNGTVYTESSSPLKGDPLYDIEGNIISYISEVYTDSTTNKVYIKSSNNYSNFASGTLDTDAKANIVSVNTLEPVNEKIEPGKYYISYESYTDSDSATIKSLVLNSEEIANYSCRVGLFNNRTADPYRWPTLWYIKTDDGYTNDFDTIYNIMAVNQYFGEDGYYKVYTYTGSTFVYANIDLYPSIDILH